MNNHLKIDNSHLNNNKTSLKTMYAANFNNEKSNLSIVDELTDIIKNEKINTLFQPIISLKNNEILGFEALSRGPKNSRLQSPAMLFKTARRNDMLFDLDKVCRKNALKRARNLDEKYKIFLNVDPLVIYDQDFKKGITKNYLEKYSIKEDNVVIELTEKTFLKNCHNISKVITHYKDQGFNIAIDDTGAGFSGLQSIVSISHNYLKMDKSLIRNIDKDKVKRSLLEAFLIFAKNINSKVIAEGIENKKELQTLVELGVDYGQGYYIKKPQSNFLVDFDLKLSKKSVEAKDIQNKNTHSKTIIGLIAKNKNELKIRKNTKIKDIVKLFKKNPHLNRLIIIEDNLPIGLIMRDKLYYKLGTRYGYSIYMDKTAEEIMNKNPITFNYYTPINKVSKIAMNRKEENIYDYIIITKNNKYYGSVSVRDILMRFSELKIEEAKNCNPLTNLPGNLSIETEINKRIKENKQFSVLYLDLDNFKAFNDNYGYKKGDNILTFTANLLRKNTENYDFVGHIGGDDFIIVTEPNRDEIISKKIIKQFDKDVINFFNQTDKKNGYMQSKDRQGKKKKIPLTSISIAIVSNENKSFKSHLEVSDIASEIKKLVKSKEGSNYIKDRRQEEKVNYLTS